MNGSIVIEVTDCFVVLVYFVVQIYQIRESFLHRVANGLREGFGNLVRNRLIDLLFNVVLRIFISEFVGVDYKVHVKTAFWSIECLWIELVGKRVVRLRVVVVSTVLRCAAAIAPHKVEVISAIYRKLARLCVQATIDSVRGLRAVILVVALNGILRFAELGFDMRFLNNSRYDVTSVSMATVVGTVLALVFVGGVIETSSCRVC